MAKRQITNLSALQKEFKDHLESMGKGGLHLRDVFDDFLFMASTAMRQAVHTFRKGVMDMELEQSLQILKNRYAVPNKFGEGLGILVRALEIEPHDFLGQFYGAIDAQNERSGQFFTPDALSEMCARMMLNKANILEHVDKGERFTIAEPALGAGGMIIQCARLMKEWGISPRHWYVDGVDVDPRCCRMAYIQFTLLGIPAMVRHGNTLSVTVWDSWPTIALAMNPYFPKRKTGLKPVYRTPKLAAPQPEKTSTIPQLTIQGRSQPGQRPKLRLVRNA